MVFDKSIDELKQLKKSLYEEIHIIDSAISILEKRNGLRLPTDDILPKKSNIKTNIYDLILNHGKLITREEIQIKGNFNKNIAAHLSTNNKIINYKIKGIFYWGLSNWFNNGHPLPQYMP